MMISNAKYYIKSTISSTQADGTTFLLSTDTELGQNLETGSTPVSMVLKNGTQIERFEITATGGVGTIVKRGLTQSSTLTEDSNLRKQWQDGTLAYVTVLAFDVLDKQGDTMTGALKFSGVTNEGLVVNSLTTAQRTALTPDNGCIVYDSTLGEIFQYIGGSWSAVSSGSTQPNASTSVAGKVEIGTQTEINNVTDTGSTGALNVVIPSTLDAKVFKQTSLSNSGITGEIKIWSTLTPPTNWLICDGSAISRTTYANLFGVIGTTYGVGDGSTTFNLPNMKGRAVVGYDASQTEFNALAKTGGEKTHTLDITEIPSHSHSLPTTQVGVGSNYKYFGTQSNLTPGTDTNTGNTGGGLAHNNLQPYVTMTYIIRY